MSDEEYITDDDSADDFSASEDDWVPNKKSCPSDSATGSSSEVETPTKKAKITEISKTSVVRKKISSIETLRSKLFKKYQPRPSAVQKPGNSSKERSNETDDSSDSGDDHLVDPSKIDFSSSYFDSEKSQLNLSSGNKKLKSESEEDDEDKDKAGISEKNDSDYYRIDFSKLQNSNKQLEDAKKHFKNYKANNFVQKNENVNVTELLALGETASSSSATNLKKIVKNKKETKKVKIEKYENDSDWEEVDDLKLQPTCTKSKDVEVMVALSQLTKPKRNKDLELQLCLQRKLNKVKRDFQYTLHKANLVCWIAHMNNVNQILNNTNLMSLATTLIPSQNCYPKDKTDLKYFEQLSKWLKQLITLKEKDIYPKLKKLPSLYLSLAIQLKTKTAICKRDYVFIFVILIRAIGMQCRIVMNVVTAPLRPPQSELISFSKESKIAEKKSEKNKSERFKKQNKDLIMNEKVKIEEIKKSKIDNLKKTKNEDLKISSEIKKLGKSHSIGKNKNEIENVKQETPKLSSERPVRITRRTANLNKLSSPSKLVTKSNNGLEKVNKSIEIPNQNKGTSKINIKKLVDLNLRKRQKDDNFMSNSDDDFCPSPTKRISPQQNVKIKTSVLSKSIKALKKIDRRVLSTDEEETKNIVKNIGLDYWVEVYSETDKKWFAIDIFKAKVDCVNDIIKSATHPMTYVLAWDNNNSIRDISQRYCTQWNCIIKKRVDTLWWNKTLLPFKGKRQEYDFEEEIELNKFQLSQPLPTTISEFKDHPLYALRRHLLKFQDIYPPDAVTLGFIRKEPVYARECVCTLHSREMWLKDAKVVKPGEKPYKIVTARPKWDRYNQTVIKDQLLEIFGVWQTQPYEPPTAENGIVPRNAYGNVELFKPTMLPKKTVHLQLNGLNKVCKKLRIDCAPAVVGFDFHSGYSHPTFDGFVICEEFSEIVTNAWIEDQEETEKRQQEKYDKRVYGNWRKLIRGLLIRERLNIKYNFKLQAEKEEKIEKKRKK